MDVDGIRAETERVGVWFVGARGSVATTAIAGAAAVNAGLAGQTGLVTELPGFPQDALPPLAGLVFGGHDVATTPLLKRAEQLAQGGVLPTGLPAMVRGELDAADAEIRPGVPNGVPGPQAEESARLCTDIRDFRARHRLSRVVVVDVSSTEPPAAPHPAHHSAEALAPALDGPDPVLPPSALYAHAAIRSGSSHVGFTPSTGVRLPALAELALSCGVPYAGYDGKTGETLVKSVLAPLFSTRALKVRSWSGVNLLGGGDGATLASPEAAASKMQSKQRGLEAMLSGPVEGAVHIDNVPELGDWKTAWDHISFEGFLGVRMTMSFTWAGCDSALAAPLVLDLARLTAAAHAAGRSGPLPELAFFFKEPLGTDEHRLLPQYELLRAFAGSLGRPR
ncbi:myo-inositol-1-phosphate synthase [Streptacidiphilus sp. MAP12-16]|uniref:inositol-3-phosphate synthase n=1 Tax=Streptacidiphilus sp. MAP12-16 TaxID=3156300 RepID=UPI003516DC57